LLDTRGAPTSQPRIRPTIVRLVCRPPDGPALTPIARVWRDLKDAVAWRPCADLHAQPDSLSHLRQAEEAATRPSLRG
jgi:hypothetical protein